MKNNKLVFLCALILSACAAGPDTKYSSEREPAGGTDAVEHKAAGEDEWETYCKQEKVLGSNLPEKVCYRRRATQSQ